LRAKTEIVDGREKVTAGVFPLEIVRWGRETAVVEVETLGWNGIGWPSPLTVLTDPLDTFFLVRLPSESGVGCGRPGSGLDTTNGGKALIGWGPDCGPYTRVAGEGEGSILTSSAANRGESLASLGVRNLLIEDDPVDKLDDREAGVVWGGVSSLLLSLKDEGGRSLDPS
jgi:hypothetical protein